MANVYEITEWDRVLADLRSRPGSALRGQIDAVGQGTGANAATAAEFAREVFARCYADPQRSAAESEAPGWVRGAHDAISALPEVEGLRASVAGDPDLSALAAAELLSAIAGKAAELARAAESERPETAPEAAAARAALRRAVERAELRVGEAREALAGLAPGLEAAPPSHDQRNTDRWALVQRVQRDARLLDVLRRAGRIARLARERNQTRDLHAREEVVDVERGADLARILPSGLSRLAHPTLRKLALREIVERQALQYRLEGRETLGRGPMIVLVDRSSSMQGDGERWASAAALALLGIAAKERRTVTIGEFTARVDTAVRVAPGAAHEIAVRDLSPARETTHAAVALAIASRVSSGGTDFTDPLRFALAAGTLDERADLVFVTDGCASADPSTIATLTAAKGRGLRVYGFTVNGGSISAGLRPIVDVAVDLDREPDPSTAIANAIPAR